MQEYSAISIVPPLIVLFIGYLTRKILLSLSVGILCAALIANEYQLIAGVLYSLERIWDNLELHILFSKQYFWQSENGFICIFLFILGIFINLMHRSGGAYAYERFIKRRLASSKQVEASTLMLSTSLLVDDYFSSLTVGSVMKSITDAFKIPRAKLAYLVDAMAAPLTILCPVSSWVAAIVGFLRDNGINSAGNGSPIIASPFMAYLNIIPFTFYSFVIIFGSWFIVLKGISFGIMKKHEDIAKDTGDVFGGKTAPDQQLTEFSGSNQNSSLLDFFIPGAVLITFIFLGIIYSGDSIWFGGQNSLVEALRNARAPLGLFIGGMASLCFSITYYLLRKRIAVTTLPHAIHDGIKLMLPSTLVLILAWTLGSIMRHDLKTGAYIAEILTGKLDLSLLPVMFFVASSLTSFAIGSSWGTAAIMFPIAIQLVLSSSGLATPVMIEEIPLIFPCLGAVLSGCVAGDHLSPISDTTIMTSTSTGMDHTDHVETQMTYAIPMILITICAYLALSLCTTQQYLPAGVVILACSFGALAIYLKFRHVKANCR